MHTLFHQHLRVLSPWNGTVRRPSNAAKKTHTVTRLAEAGTLNVRPALVYCADNRIIGIALRHLVPACGGIWKYRDYRVILM